MIFYNYKKHEIVFGTTKAQTLIASNEISPLTSSLFYCRGNLGPECSKGIDPRPGFQQILANLTSISRCPFLFGKSHIESHIYFEDPSFLVESRVESHIESWIESHIESRVESHIESRVESYIESRVESYIESWVEL